jgi:hypothetical protein
MSKNNYDNAVAFQNTFVAQLRAKFDFVEMLASKMLSREGEIFNYGLMADICEFLLSSDVTLRCQLIELLDSKIDLFNADPISNLIIRGFVDAIDDDLQLSQLLAGMDATKNRKIVLQFFINRYIPTNYEVPLKFLRLYLGIEMYP